MRSLGSISFATDSTRPFFVLVLVIVAVSGFFVRRLLRGATGRGLDAWRLSPLASAGLGYSPNRTKVVVFALSAAVAGLGGGLWGSLLQVVSPADFTYADSLLFVVIVVTVGVRTVAGAVEAGVGFALLTHGRSPLLGWRLHLRRPSRRDGRAAATSSHSGC